MLVLFLSIFAATIFVIVGIILEKSFKADREWQHKKVILAEWKLIERLNIKNADLKHQLEMAVKTRDAVIKNYIAKTNQAAIDKITTVVTDEKPFKFFRG